VELPDKLQAVDTGQLKVRDYGVMHLFAGDLHPGVASRGRGDFISFVNKHLAEGIRCASVVLDEQNFTGSFHPLSLGE
jgi:hypothetical protein